MHFDRRHLEAGPMRIVAVHPHWRPHDLHTLQDLVASLAELGKTLGERGWATARDLWVFPADGGEFLYGLNEWAATMRAPTWHRAMSLGLLDEKIWKWAAPLWRGAPVGWKHAVGLEYRRAKAAEVALSYHTAFAGMSQAFGVTVVGPSLALPVVGESEEGWKVDKRAPFKRVAGVFSLGKLVKTASQASLALDDEAWQIVPGEGSATWTASEGDELHSYSVALGNDPAPKRATVVRLARTREPASPPVGTEVRLEWGGNLWDWPSGGSVRAQDASGKWHREITPEGLAIAFGT